MSLRTTVSRSFMSRGILVSLGVAGVLTLVARLAGRTLPQSLLLGAVAAGAGVLVMVATVRMWVKDLRVLVLSRLERFADHVRAIRDGDTAEPLLEGSPVDEIDALAEEVDLLVSDLEHTRLLTEESRDVLEERVRQRTEALQDAVRNLMDEAAKREMAQYAQSRSDERYRSLVENLSDVVFALDVDGRITFVNSSVQRMFGYDVDELVGKPLASLLTPDSARRFDGQLRTCQIEGTCSLELAGLSVDGRPVEIELVLSTSEPGGESVQGIIRDVTVRRRHEAELAHIASHDYLTGLYNRRRFEEELARELAESARHSTRGAVLWFDLDHFKDVNDTLGHRVGDELLARVGQTLVEVARAESTLARIGGDEFAVLLPRSSTEEAMHAAERLVGEIAKIVMDHDGETVRVSASLGVALYPDHGQTVEEILSHADVAMYFAKESGRARAVMFAPDEDWRAQITERRSWADRIGLAFADERLVMYAQPIHEFGGGPLRWFELLVRIRDTDGSLISPEQFLPAAEQVGLVYDIDAWVLRRAFDIFETFPGHDLHLNVNASAHTWSDPRYRSTAEMMLASATVEPGQLGVEITETAIISDLGGVREAMRSLKELGCRIVLDDFGSGFSSFFHLKQLPIDDLKIDGTYVRRLVENHQDQYFVRAIVELARGLGMSTTAEYVGSEETMRMLEDFGIDKAQGYAVGKPGPAYDVIREALGRQAS